MILKKEIHLQQIQLKKIYINRKYWWNKIRLANPLQYVRSSQICFCFNFFPLKIAMNNLEISIKGRNLRHPNN